MKKLFTLLFILFTLNTNAQLLTEKDKQTHFAAGSIVGAISYGVILQETEDKHLAFFGSITTAFVVGALKETLDARERNNRFDKRDLYATTLGGLSIGVTLDIFTRNGKKKGRIFNINFK